MKQHTSNTHDTTNPSPSGSDTAPVDALCAPPADPARDPTPVSSISPVSNPENRRPPGRFVAGISGNPNGRPRGSLNKSTLFAGLLTKATTKDLTKKVIEAAIAGNPAALKFCMAQLCPVRKDSPVSFNHPQSGAPADLLAAYDDLVHRMATGEITPRQAHSISRILEARRRSWESTHAPNHV